MRQSNLIFATCNWCKIKVDTKKRTPKWVSVTTTTTHTMSHAQTAQMLYGGLFLASQTATHTNIEKVSSRSALASNNFDRRIASSISNAIYWMKATNQCLILSLSNLSRYSLVDWRPKFMQAMIRPVWMTFDPALPVPEYSKPLTFCSRKLFCAEIVIDRGKKDSF